MTRQHLALVAGGSAEGEGVTAHAAGSTGVGPLECGLHTLRLFGELSQGSAHMLEAEIERLCARGIDGLTLDLSRLESIDWSGVRVIAFRHEWCTRRGCELTLIAGPPQVQSVFEREGLSERLPFGGVLERRPFRHARVLDEAGHVSELYMGATG
jgi:anti-anti-sigma factor